MFCRLPKGRPPKTLKAQENDIRFVNFSNRRLINAVGSRGCFVAGLIPSFLLRRMWLKAEYTGPYDRISTDDQMAYLHGRVHPKHALEGIAVVEESLRSTARSVVAAAEAADMSPVRWASLRRYVQVCCPSPIERKC